MGSMSLGGDVDISKDSSSSHPALAWARSGPRFYPADWFPQKHHWCCGKAKHQTGWLNLEDQGFRKGSFVVAFHSRTLVTSGLAMNDGSYPGRLWLQAGSSYKVGNTRSCFSAWFLLILCILSFLREKEVKKIQPSWKTQKSRWAWKKKRQDKGRNYCRTPREEEKKGGYFCIPDI